MNILNLRFLEEIYARYRADPATVDASWRHFFDGMAFAGEMASSQTGEDLDWYRAFGHLRARFDPLAVGEVSAKGATTDLQNIYCARIGFDYMDVEDPEVRAFIQQRVEQERASLSNEDKQWVLESLHKAEVFETFIHTKFVGQKRFSLEGAETLIPVLEGIIDQGAQLGVNELVIGMAHRGRLNVLANILQKPYSVIFQEFEDLILPLLHEGSGDVKYHKGFHSRVTARGGASVSLHLAANSSSLESVDPIVLGQARAMRGGALLIHGDAAITGQGVVYEILELMKLPGYSTAGTIHIVLNNQIGFTTLPQEGRSTRYCTDIAKAFGCPIFHVNGEDPEGCLFVARLAVELRVRFGIDVFIDLNCYRKYGHNEGDEPAFTQPQQYQIIRAKQSVPKLYFEQLVSEGVVDSGFMDAIDAKIRGALDVAFKRGKESAPHAPEEKFGASWRAQPPSATLYEPFDSSASEELLRKSAASYCRVPEGFHLHPKLQKWLQERLAMLDGRIDWGMGECLAFGTLLSQKIPIRLSGQDSCRGTFSQRHAIWVDQESGSLYAPFGDSFAVYNSPLSEYAVLGFEFGFTWGDSKTLVLWEAQYGDFAFGAEIIIDHYLTTAEQKWARYSSLVLLLPHGYEGQGPEHSSGRIERFLQLCANENIQVVNATTPAQYFHVLRRQALRPIKKPLVVFTPKSLLRLPACSSSLAEFTTGSFQEVLDDPANINAPRRVLFCSGKIYYDLLKEREARKAMDIAILRMEQLYPVHNERLTKLLVRYAGCTDFVWVQEEPENMGAWEFVRRHLPKSELFRYVGRKRSAVTATGSFKQHAQELERIMAEAFHGN